MAKQIWPLVSIAVPAYNHEKYVDCFLKSVLIQDYPNIELIIGDDCSTDRTYEIIESYRKQLEDKCRRVVIYQNDQNYGLVKSLNKIIGHCRGDYIKTMASDDFLTPASISEYMKYAMENPQVEAIISDGYVIGDSVMEVEQLAAGKNVTISTAVNGFEIDENWVAHVYEDNIFGVGIFYKSSVYSKAGMYDESLFYDDWDMNLRVAISNVKYGILHKPLVAYRIHDSSISHDMSDDKRLRLYEGALKIYDKYADYVGEEVRKRAIVERSYRFLREGYVYGLEKVVKRTTEELRGLGQPLFWWKCCHARTIFVYWLRKWYKKLLHRYR